MKPNWEQALGSLFNILGQEGGRLVRNKARALLHRVVSGARIGMMLAYSVMILCFLCALSAFAALLLYSVRLKLASLGVPSWTLLGASWPAPLWLAAATFASTLSLLWITTSRTLWERALGISDRQNASDDAPTQVNISLGGVDEQKIVELVDRAVEKRLNPAKKRAPRARKSA